MKFKYLITCAVLKTLLYLFFSELDLILLSFFQSPDSDFKHKSKDSLSSGIHLTVASDDTMSMSPEADPPHLPCAGLNPPQMSEAREPPGLLCDSQRFPSLPEHLENSTEMQDIQRHVSDPVLPGS